MSSASCSRRSVIRSKARRRISLRSRGEVAAHAGSAAEAASTAATPSRGGAPPPAGRGAGGAPPRGAPAPGGGAGDRREPALGGGVLRGDLAPPAGRPPVPADVQPRGDLRDPGALVECGHVLPQK